jgi:hypothetical protein
MLPRASRSLAGALIAVCLVPGEAGANYFTYAEWRALSPSARYAYISGAFDTLTTVADGATGAKTSLHYGNCVAGARMSNGQLSDNLQKFADSQPRLQAGTVQKALIEYLLAACGPIP